jgi:hypothetical protein
VRNASNDVTFDSVEPPVIISTPRISSVLSPVTKKATSTVSIEIHKGAIFDRLEIKIIIDIATKFEIQNCDHPTLIVLNSDWSSLGCLFSITA